MDDPVAAAIERLEEHRQRLIAEKVAKGEAVLRAAPAPVVIGSPCRKRVQELSARQQHDEQGREIYYDKPDYRFIVTGAPRADFPCPECDGSCAVKSTKPAYDALAYRRELEKHSEPPAPPMPKPTPELKIPTEFWPFRVQIRAGNGGDDPGAIIEGRYGVSGDVVYVEDDQGKPVDMQHLRPGENAAAAAQRILREKWRGKTSVPGFYDGPINRPTTTFH